MSKKVLVGYATRMGSTVGVAEEIGRTLGTLGFDVDVKPIQESPSLGGYDAVVLGSGSTAVSGCPKRSNTLRPTPPNSAICRSLSSAYMR